MHCWILVPPPIVYIGRAQNYGRSLHICWRQYHEAVAFKWKYFQIIKWIQNQLFEWRASKLHAFIEGNGVKA